MAEHKDNIEIPRNKEEMIQRLSADSSRAFLDDVKPDMTQTKVQAQAEWWQSLNKENPAPAHLDINQLPELQKNGWQFKPDANYNKLSRDLKDGSHEEDTYDNRTGKRLNTVIARYEDKQAHEPGKAVQFIDVYYRDGQNLQGVSIRSGYFNNEFRATYNEQGKLASAYEWGKNKDSVSYSFREDGSLYEALKRSRATSDVINDQIFDRAGKPVSDYNPLYLYEKAKRPVVDFYMGLSEMRRSGGIF